LIKEINALGKMKPQDSISATIYDGNKRGDEKIFVNGLAADGVIELGTIAALNFSKIIQKATNSN
jgi:hypothetical protein